MRPFFRDPSGFFKRAWRNPLRRYIYLLLWPWFVPAVSYLIFGPALLADAGSLASGLVAVLLVCTAANEADTYTLLRIVRRYPAPGQSAWRLGWMGVLFSAISLLAAEGSLRLFSLTRFLGYTYTPDTSLWVMVFVVVSSIVAAGLVESAYASIQWHANQVEKQTLEQQHVRAQLDALKSRINPHFLFNSLNSISALIADDPWQAERFVDELSKVYRYMLQANLHHAVTLDTELRFIRSYVRLLEGRYGNALRISMHIAPQAAAGMLPPLSLQMLLDDLIQHNVVMAKKPLSIELRAAGPDRLQIRYTRQPRAVRIGRDLSGLDELSILYRWLSDEPIRFEHTQQEGIISLPLLRDVAPPPALPSIQP